MLSGRCVKAYQVPCPTLPYLVCAEMNSSSHSPPLEWPATSQRFVFAPGPSHPMLSIHAGIASIAASTSAKPQTCQSSPLHGVDPVGNTDQAQRFSGSRACLTISLSASTPAPCNCKNTGNDRSESRGQETFIGGGFKIA